MSEERRQFSRVQFQSDCHLKFGDQRYKGALYDISLKGALISCEEKPFVETGGSCQFELNLSGTGIVLTFDADLVYRKEDQYGIKFGNIDLESMIHLRRLVELNTGDSNLVQNELFFLISSEK